MARGWESKSVESQIEEAEARAALAQREQRSAQAIRLEKERESLELSRSRVLKDLEQAANPKYREILGRSLAFLDEKLAALPVPPSKS